MGRKTYEIAAAEDQGMASPAIETYAFSRTLNTPPPGATLVSEDAADFVHRLKEQPGMDICRMGGGDLARSHFDADLIDVVGLNIHPILLQSSALSTSMPRNPAATR